MKRLMKTIVGLFATLACAALQSCAMVSFMSYNVDVLKPADYTLPENVRKIVLIDCAEDAQTDSALLSGAQHTKAWEQRITTEAILPQSERQLNYMSRIPQMICTFISTDVNSGGFKDVVTDKRCWPYALALQYVDTLCEVVDADAVLLLHNYNFSNTLVNVMMMGSDVCVTQYAVCNAQLTLVEKNGQQYDFEARTDTLEWQYCDETLDGVLASMPHYSEVYYSIAEQVGRAYAFQMVPQWYTRTRYILSTPDRNMQDAALWTERGNWDNAADIWREVYRVSVGAQRARAAYNLSLYYEHEGLIDEAAIWCSKALDYYGTKPKRRLRAEAEVISKQFEELVERQKDFDKLDRQTRR